MTPLKAILKHCIWCCGGGNGGDNSTKRCNSPKCSLYSRRTGKGAGPGALKAIRLRCLECVGGSSDEVKLCKEVCTLNPYKEGHNPKRKGLGDSKHLKQYRFDKTTNN